MYNTTKKLIKKVGFPDHLAPDEVKNTDEFGLQMAKAIEYEWFYRANGSGCSYYDKRDNYHKLRLYARGEQDTQIYKDLLTGGKDKSYTNYDWRPLQIVPKFVKLITNQMSERLFDVKAEATDKYSTDLKDSYKTYLEDLVIAKPIMQKAKDVLGVDIFPENYEDYPATQEEIDLHMKLKYKPAIEIATEEAIKYTLDLNDYDEVQSRFIEDQTVLGIGCIKHTTDRNEGIVIEYVDPANLVYSYPIHRNFKDVYYYGEVRRITINELKRISNVKFTDEELQEMVDNSYLWTGYHGDLNDQKRSDEELSGGVGNVMVDILHFNFKSTNTISYKKKILGNGGYKMTKKESTFNKKNPDDEGYEVRKKIIDVWYEGTLILGTEYIFNYKLCENMIRPEGYLNKTLPNYLVYAPELYQNRTKSLVERIIPYVDEMQQIHIKLQQFIAKARPNGIYIDIDGLNEVSLGEGGGNLTPLELIRIYDDTGNVLGTSNTTEGDYNYGRQPIQELRNGVYGGIGELINTYNHYLNLLRDAIGIPAGADASMPHPDTLVGVQQQVALNSNTATRHILDSALNVTERLGKALSLRLKDIFKYSDLKNVYINAIGKLNVEVLKAIEKYHLHDLGITIELKPDIQEKQYLEQNIQQALQQGLISLDDAIDIRSINNIKLANEVLKTRRIKREKEAKAQQEKMAKMQQETQLASIQQSAQAKQQELQMKSQIDLALVQAKTQSRIMELEAEKKAKSELMQQEFNYNMTLKGIEVESNIINEKYKEDRKDSRQDRQNTQASKMIEQRNYNSPSLDFESSEDNMGSGIEMGELEPS